MPNYKRIIQEEELDILSDIYSSIVTKINDQDELVEDDYDPFHDVDWYNPEEADNIIENIEYQSSEGYHYYHSIQSKEEERLY